MSITKVCDDCTALLKWIPSYKRGSPHYYEYPKVGLQLKESRYCKLCKMIAPHFDHDLEQITNTSIFPIMDPHAKITAMKIWYHTPKRMGIRHIYMWADKGET